MEVHKASGLGSEAWVLDEAGGERGQNASKVRAVLQPREVPQPCGKDEPGIELPSKSPESRANPEKPAFSPDFVHLLFTAADAKIPLYVGQVKREPQYVVFSCGCKAPSSATARFRCAKRKKPRKWRVPRPRSTQNQVPDASLDPFAASYKAQNRCIFCGPLWELWRTQDATAPPAQNRKGVEALQLHAPGFSESRLLHFPDWCRPKPRLSCGFSSRKSTFAL